MNVSPMNKLSTRPEPSESAPRVKPNATGMPEDVQAQTQQNVVIRKSEIARNASRVR